MENKIKNKYYLIYDDGKETPGYAVVGIENVYEHIKWQAMNGIDKLDCRIREVSLREWVNAQLEWEDEGADLEREAQIYEWAAKLAREDMNK